MIDLHNHILYDWDDGPSTLDKSLEMARQAVSVGTTHMVATPHRYVAGSESRAAAVKIRVDELNQSLTALSIPLTILPGVEIPIEFGIAEELSSGRLSTLAGGSYALLEPPFPSFPSHLIPAIKELIDFGYGVVLAHPERNSEIQKNWVKAGNLSLVKACAELGCIIQLTSGSIAGRFGTSALTTSRAIASQTDWRIVIASDSHEPKDLTPAYLGLARDTVAAWIEDSAAASKMVEELPAEIIGL